MTKRTPPDGRFRPWIKRRRIARRVPASPVRREDRQLFVLKHLSHGLTASQIAQEASTSSYAVHDWIKVIKQELGALNTPHAVAIAIRKGMIK
jgi:DNA-binding NarL/FixJ family response regulator